MEPLNIFISYARQDGTELTTKIAKLLQDNGHRVWYDAKIEPGQDFSQTISQAIGEADCVIPLLTPSSFNSLAMDSEIRYAQYWSRERRLAYLPVAVHGDFEVPTYLKNEYFMTISPGFTATDRKRLLKRLQDIKMALSTKAPAERDWRRVLEQFTEPAEILGPVQLRDALVHSGLTWSSQSVLLPWITYAMVQFKYTDLLEGHWFGVHKAIQAPRFEEIEFNVIKEGHLFAVWAEGRSGQWAVDVLPPQFQARVSDYTQYLTVMTESAEQARAAAVWLVMPERDAAQERVLTKFRTKLRQQLDLYVSTTKDLQELIERLGNLAEPTTPLPPLLRSSHR